MQSLKIIQKPVFLTVICFIYSLLMVGNPSALAGDSPSVLVNSRLDSDRLIVTLESVSYRIVEQGQHHRIEMEGFGDMTAPGKPMLPSKRILLALPTGARALSVEVKPMVSKKLPGTYRIIPAPPLVILTDSPNGSEEIQAEWQGAKERIYSSDERYPESCAALACSGTLRKYSYASVEFRPFTYHPRSGRLIHHKTVQVTIHYSMPEPRSAEAKLFDALRWDTLADDQAVDLFANYKLIKQKCLPRKGGTTFPLTTHDYVIITHSSLVSAVTSTGFEAWKAHLGYNTRIVLTSDPEIAGQPGVDMAQKIRNFLRSHYGYWGIKYVLLVGNCITIPMRYCYPNPDDHTNNGSNPSNPGGAVPTDYYYADLSYPDEVAWDSDCDGFPGEYKQDNPDFMAEVFVGRIPTSNKARISYTLEKLIAFEQSTGAWKNQALHAGAVLAFGNQNHSGQAFADGARCPHQIEVDLMNGWPVSRYSEQEGLQTSLWSWPALNEPAFVTDWRNGQYGVVVWSAHGGYTGAGRMVWVWDDGDGVPETDGSDIINHPAVVNVWSNLDDDYPSIVFAISCSVGYPEPQANGNMGVDLLTKPGFGASAGILSASRSAMARVEWPSTPGGVESLCYEFNRYVISESEGLGDATYHSKFYCSQNCPTDHYYDYQNLFGYNLYGDPALVK